MRIFSLLAIAALLATPALQAEEALTLASGADLYAQLCASCHGPEGRGDGPVAATLSTRPSDLTRITARYGEFPDPDLFDVVDGRAVIPAHGSREMPVWGYELEARTPDDAPGRAGAQEMLARIIDHLRTLQAPVR